MTATLAGAEERVDGLEKGKISYQNLKNPGQTCVVTILFSLGSILNMGMLENEFDIK